MKRVGDLVRVRDIRTVVHLRDAGVAEAAAELARGFVATPQCAAVLEAVRARLAGRTGGGLFVQGSYGCGKSHLLAYLALRTENALVATLPLVDHPARAPLEELVTGALARALAARGLPVPPAPGVDREAWKQGLARTLAAAGADGALLLVDELSEFLRAKPDGRSFTEDVRFLQYLGEATAEVPLVVVAGLQEGLDETGPIAPAAFDKIKDRYPGRYFLTAEHVGELVARRVLEPVAGARPAVDAVHRRLAACVPSLGLDAERFARFYPVHPATLDFLGELKPLFSQHRGVVDFLVQRLRPLMDEPADTLLTPDAIFDHFEPRVRERVESAPLVEGVLGWWRAHLPEVFPEPAERALALRALKVLALAALFPYERPVDGREMAGLLAIALTDLEPRVNERAARDVLARLAAGGPYVTRDERGYRVRAAEDAALVVRARVRELALALEGRDEEIARAVTLGVDEAHLPLATLAARGRLARAVTWQGTPREG